MERKQNNTNYTKKNITTKQNPSFNKKHTSSGATMVKKIDNRKNVKFNRNTTNSNYSSYRKKPFNSKYIGNKNNTKRRKIIRKTKIEYKIPELKDGFVRVIPLGGVEEVGQNMSVIETKDDIFILDAGFEFVSEGETPGIDYIIPNIKYLIERKNKIRAMLITHGHLDHIGAIPFILEQLGSPPIYTSNLTSIMIKKRNEEFPNMNNIDINIISAPSRFKIGNTNIQSFPVTHSIPEAMGFIFETDEGNIIFSGDLKLSHKDGIPKLHEKETFSSIGKLNNNLLYVQDSTNAEQVGFSNNEENVLASIEKIIKNINGRIFIGAFASQFHRLIGFIKIAEKYNKKVIVDGRGIETNIKIALLSGLLKPKEGTIIPIEDMDNYPPNKIMVLLTGAQGEEFASLMRISTKKHRFIRFKESDSIILSSSIIPGNEISVQKLKDNLTRHGIRLIHYKTSDVHASGHGNIEELKWVQKTIGAKYFMPAYGYHSMLRAHALGIIDGGHLKENIIIPDDGTIIDLNQKEFIIHKEKAPNNIVVVDGFKVGDIQNVVIRDRKTLTKEGFVVVVATIDLKSRRLRKSPDIISRGFVYLRDSQELIQETRKIVKIAVLKTITGRNPIDFDTVKKRITDDVVRYILQQTAKRPIVIPVILGI